MHNSLTNYNSKTESGYHVSSLATVKSLLLEFVQNWQCTRCHNTIIVGGDLLNEVKNMRNVQKLFREGVAKLYDKDKKAFTAGSSFKGDFWACQLMKLSKNLKSLL